MRAVLFGMAMAGFVGAARAEPSHALAVLGEPRLAAGFAHLPYVNPDAPKGGTITVASLGSFDSLNPFIVRGTSGAGLFAVWVPYVGSSTAGSGIGHVWESLLTPSADEAATAYGHLAKSVEFAPDRLSIAFELRPEARFSDGTPVTAEDVAWTFTTLRTQGRPSFRVAFADVRDVTVENPHRVVFHFSSSQNRQLPLDISELPVLPKHWFAGRDFTAPLTDIPPGSGPYRIERVDFGREIVYARRPDWWARDLPIARGTENFDRVKVEYFRDATVAMEAFKAGQIDIRMENIARNWATGYDFPAARDGRVRRAEIRHHLPTGMQGFAMNTRRAPFQDRRVREALTLAFDFEWMNKTLFYGAYTRTLSYFSNSDLAATGLPDAEELKLLAPFRDRLPPELFTQPYTLPVTDGSGNNRPQLRAALALLKQAGWSVKDRALVDRNGQPMRFTFLLPDPSYERVALPYAETLRKLGIDVSVRTVDPAQYQHMMDNYDYDMTLTGFPEGDLPGNEQRDYWSCASARTSGEMNLMGVCDPAVDALVEKVVNAPDRASLRTAARALDRVLLWGFYAVPNWHSQTWNVAWWDRFAEPGIPFREGFNLDTWWAK